MRLSFFPRCLTFSRRGTGCLSLSRRAQIRFFGNVITFFRGSAGSPGSYPTAPRLSKKFANFSRFIRSFFLIGLPGGTLDPGGRVIGKIPDAVLFSFFLIFAHDLGEVLPSWMDDQIRRPVRIQLGDLFILYLYTLKN